LVEWRCSHSRSRKLPATSGKSGACARIPSACPPLDSAQVREAQRKVEAMIAADRPFEEIEGLIDSMPLPEEQLAALWLVAWAEQDVGTHQRDTLEALTHVSD
jgi:hypothetical protein